MESRTESSLQTMEHLNKMEFFQKLGYSREDVVRVLDKLGEGALVNDILQELIQMGSRHGPREASTVPLLVPRGSCGTLDSTQHRLRTDLEEECGNPASLLRPIVIDGSNVAMSHGNKEAFSCRGIQLAVDWFRERGHTYIKVFVPSWRKEPPRSDTPIREQHVLEELERQAVLVYTPSRKVSGKRVVCYDDRYIVKVAIAQDGVIVSNDNYRDLQSENPEWKWFIEQRLLMFSFVNDRFMPPDDPLGRRGPTLSNFLSKKPKPPEPSWQHCPYGKKCTYGVKCKFYHPERPRQTQLAVADELRAQTRAWRGAGREPGRSPAGRGPAGREPGCPRGAAAAAWPCPREPGAPRLPRGAAALAAPEAREAREAREALEGRFSRLRFSDDPGLLGAPPSGAGCGLAPGPLCPDWGAPAASPSPAPRAGLQGGCCPGGAQNALRPRGRQPAHPWAPPEGPGGFPPRPAVWADPSWGLGASRGLSTVEAQEAGAPAPPHPALRSLFPPRRAGGVLPPGPAICAPGSAGASSGGDPKGLVRPWEGPKE